VGVLDTHSGDSVLGAIHFGDLVGHHVVRQHHQRNIDALKHRACERAVGAHQIHRQTSGGEDNSVETVLLPDNHRTVQDSTTDDVEHERTGGQSDVDKHRQVVEPTTVKTKSASGGVHIEISVDETDQTENAKGLVELDVVLVGEQLGYNVFESARRQILGPGLVASAVCALRVLAFSGVFVTGHNGHFFGAVL